MSLEFDLELRTAVFHQVQRLRDEMGGVVTPAALNAGIIVKGQRIPIWSQQKGIFRPAVLRDPGAALTIQTAFNGPYDDRWAPNDERLAYKSRRDRATTWTIGRFGARWSFSCRSCIWSA